MSPYEGYILSSIRIIQSGLEEKSFLIRKQTLSDKYCYNLLFQIIDCNNNDNNLKIQIVIQVLIITYYKYKNFQFCVVVYIQRNRKRNVC